MQNARYPNIKAEMARKNINVKMMSEFTGIPYNPLRNMLSGKQEMKVSDLVRIQTVLNHDRDREFTLDYLVNS